MGPILLSAVVGGTALGGVLAVCAAWSRQLRSGADLPHLGVGAVAAVGAAAAARVAATGSPVAALAAGVLGGAVAGLVVVAVDALGRRRLPDGWGDLAPDLAVLGALVAAVGLLTPRSAIDLSLGPLGIAPASPAAAIGCLVVAGAVLAVLARSGLGPSLIGMTVGALCGAAAALASGLGGLESGPGLVMAPDGIGLALRAAAAALLVRRGTVRAAGAGLGLGLAEGYVRAVAPMGAVALAPTVLALLAGTVLSVRRDAGLGEAAR